MDTHLHCRTLILDQGTQLVTDHAARIAAHLDALEPSIRDLLTGTRVVTDLAALAEAGTR